MDRYGYILKPKKILVVARTHQIFVLMICFYYYQRVDTCVDGLYHLEGITRQIVVALALTWFITYVYISNLQFLYIVARVAQWVRLLDLTAHTSLLPIRRGFAPSFVYYKKGILLDSKPQVKKLTSCLPMVGGSLRVLRLLPPLKLVAMI